MKKTNFAHLDRIVIIIIICAICAIATITTVACVNNARQKHIAELYEQQQARDEHIIFLKTLAVRPEYQQTVDTVGLKGAIIQEREDVLLHPEDEQINKYLEAHPMGNTEYGIIVENFFYDKEGNIIYSPETRSWTIEALGPYPDRGNGK